jgi:hypothetical protein
MFREHNILLRIRGSKILELRIPILTLKCQVFGKRRSNLDIDELKKYQYLRFAEHKVGLTDRSDSAKRVPYQYFCPNCLCESITFVYPQTFAENLIAGLSMQLREAELPCPEESLIKKSLKTFFLPFFLKIFM